MGKDVATLFNNAESFSETNGCYKHLRNAIMCSYRDQFIQSWHSNLTAGGNGGNKLRTFPPRTIFGQYQTHIVTCGSNSIESGLSSTIN